MKYENARRGCALECGLFVCAMSVCGCCSRVNRGTQELADGSLCHPFRAVSWPSKREVASGRVRCGLDDLARKHAQVDHGRVILAQSLPFSAQPCGARCSGTTAAATPRTLDTLDPIPALGRSKTELHICTRNRTQHVVWCGHLAFSRVGGYLARKLCASRWSSVTDSRGRTSQRELHFIISWQRRHGPGMSTQTGREQ